jgi:hypothetical protein
MRRFLIAALTLALTTAALPAVSEEKQVVGFGQNVTVERMFQRLAPPGWTVKYDARVEPSHKVTWFGGRTWREVAAEALTRAGLEMRDTGSRELTIARIGAVSPPPAAHRSTAQRMLSQPTTPQQDDAAPAPAPAPATSVTTGETWTADRGLSLRQVLANWAERAGWTISWRSPRDYRIEAGASFEGDFTKSVSNLFAAFADASPPVRATLYTGNRVVVVSIPGDDLE